MKDPCLPHDHPINQEWGTSPWEGGWGGARESMERHWRVERTVAATAVRAPDPPPTTVRVYCTDRECAELSGFAYSECQPISDPTPLPTICPRCVMPLERREY